jgi:hypothetical protein
MQQAIVIFALVFACSGPAALGFDLDAVRQEKNPEKRSDRALKNAESALNAARDAHEAGDQNKLDAALKEFSESIDLSYESLLASHKNPHGSGGYKRAEIVTRGFLRRVKDLQESWGGSGGDSLAPLLDRLAEIHDHLIESILSKKKKR